MIWDRFWRTGLHTSPGGGSAPSKVVRIPQQENLIGLLQELRKARVVIDTRPIRSLSGNKILEGSVYQRMLEARERKPDLPIPTRR